MYGSADTMGLNVYVVQDRSAKAVWSKRNNQANAWHLAQVDLTTSGAFQVSLYAEYVSVMYDMNLLIRHTVQSTLTCAFNFRLYSKDGEDPMMSPMWP